MTKKTTKIECHIYKKMNTMVYYIGCTLEEFWASRKDSDIFAKSDGKNIYLALKSLAIPTEDVFDTLVLAAEDDTNGAWTIKSVIP